MKKVIGIGLMALLALSSCKKNEGADQLKEGQTLMKPQEPFMESDLVENTKKNAQTNLALSEPDFDFGKIKKGDVVNHVFEVTNTGKNPLIISCILGALINFSEIKIPISIENLLKILSSAALPLGLISIGYTLVLKEIKSAKKDLTVTMIAKFIVLPLIIYILAISFSLDNLMIAILVLFAIMPTAPSSFILARQLGGDLPLITSIITVQTIVAALFLILFLQYFN